MLQPRITLFGSHAEAATPQVGGPRGRTIGVGRFLPLPAGPVSAMTDISVQTRLAPDGAVTTEQRLPIPEAVVEQSREAALRLGSMYWQEVERFTGCIVQAERSDGGVSLRIAGRGPALLRLGPPRVTATPTLVACRYPVEGGLLARSPGGSLTLAQVSQSGVELRLTVTDFHPSLGMRPGFPRWTGGLYAGIQARIHDAVGRRFLGRVAREAS